MEYDYCKTCSKKGRYTQPDGTHVCRYCGLTQKPDPWTQFWDMHSGGGQKDKFRQCFIQAPEVEAVSIFIAKFGHDPRHVTCPTCGEDYSINEYDSLEKATAYERNCNCAQLRETNKKTGRVRYYSVYLEAGESPPKGFELDEFQSSRETIPLKKYLKQKDVKVVRKREVKASERKPQYTW